MDWSFILISTVGLLVLLLASGMRIALAFITLAFIVSYIWIGPKDVLLVGLQTWASVRSFILCAIPLFIFMSEIMFESRLSSRIYGALSPVLDHFPGGLLHSNIVAGAFLAACTGSGIAATATIGTMALPEMEKRGYDPALSFGSVAAGGALGPIIPPSIIMIVYGAMTNVSVGKLFMAGVVPGIMMAVLFMIYTAVRVGLKPQLAPRWTGGYVTWSRSLAGMVNVWPALALMGLILGCIYTGVTTPTEAAGIGCLGAFIIAAAYREFSWRLIKKSATETVKITCMVMLIFVGANIMAAPLAHMGIFYSITKFITALPLPPAGTLSIIIVMYIILGCFLDGLPVIVFTLPITFPVITALGYNPIWFGVMITLLDLCGLLTPPVGSILFVLQGLRPDKPFSIVASGCTQYFLVIMVAIGMLVVLPEIATWLPGLMH